MDSRVDRGKYLAGGGRIATAPASADWLRTGRRLLDLLVHGHVAPESQRTVLVRGVGGPAALRLGQPPRADLDIGTGVRAFALRNAPHIVMATLFAGAVVLGVILLPGDAERIAMLERDGMERQALQLLEERFAAGDRRSRTLYQLSRFYEQTGNVAKARTTLELLAEARPRDAATQQRLALFYKNTEDTPAYVQALLRQIDARYSESACKEVVGLLRLSGDYAQEIAALQKCRHRGYRRPEDMVRLGQLLAVDGETAAASALLRYVDDLKRLKTERERLQLFAMLLETDQPREALRRGIRWAKSTRDDQLALTLIEMLVHANKQDVALEMARSVGAPGDRVSLAVAEIMLDKDEGVAAQSYLRGWLDKSRGADPTLAVRFVDAALGANDPETAFKGARKFGFAKLGQKQLVALAEGLASAGRRDELTEVFDNLTPEAVSASSVLTASVKPAQETAGGAATLAAGTANDGSLETWKRNLWNRLMAENARDAALRRMSVEKPGSTAAKAARAIRHQKKVRNLSIRYRHRPTAVGKTALPRAKVGHSHGNPRNRANSDKGKSPKANTEKGILDLD